MRNEQANNFCAMMSIDGESCNALRIRVDRIENRYGRPATREEVRKTIEQLTGIITTPK